MTSVDVRAGLADRDVFVEAALPAGRVSAVVGPNGAGKSSLLQLISGLARPSSGTVTICGSLVAGPGRWVPSHRRRVALLSQHSPLFPHLDVLANVAFGPRAAGQSRAAARDRARAELAAVGCAELAGRHPDRLSGGQARRVAIARALATDPLVVLLDEPLGGLDVTAAAEVRHVLADRLRGRTAVLVTHEVLDLFTLADRVLVMAAGRVAAEGPVSEVLERPTSAFGARLGGRNLVTGRCLAPGRLQLGEGISLHGVADAGQPPVVGEPALASFVPAAVALYLAEPAGSPRNSLAGEVTSVEARGEVARVRLLAAAHELAADVTWSAVAELGLRPGQPVWASIKAAQVNLYGR